LSGVIGLFAHLGAAQPTTIFIPVSIGQNQKKKFINRYGSTTFRAVKFSGLQFLEISLWLALVLLISWNKTEWIVFH
jgi:hypothetical protein